MRGGIEGGIYTVHLWRWCKMIPVHIGIHSALMEVV